MPLEPLPSLLEQAVQPDFVFLPHLKAMPTYEKDVHACLCPIMQGLPYTLRTAFSLDESKLLRPILDLGKAGGKTDSATRPHRR